MTLHVPPCGLTPLGLWVPVDEEQQVTRRWLVDPVDPVTRDLSSALGNGGTTAENVVDEMVKFALLTFRGSGASVLADGQAFGTVRKLVDGVEERLRGEARIALRRLVDRGLVAVVDVSVVIGVDAFDVTIQYVNKRAAERKVRTLPVRYDVGRRFFQRVAA